MWRSLSPLHREIIISLVDKTFLQSMNVSNDVHGYGRMFIFASSSMSWSKQPLCLTQETISEYTLYLRFKTVLVQNFSYENEFDLH